MEIGADFLNTPKKIMVVGLGKSGLAAIGLLRQYGHTVSVSDSSTTIDEEQLRNLVAQEVWFETGRHSTERFLQQDLILVSPGVPLSLPVLEQSRQAGIPVIGELALAPIYLKTPVVAVTGTNGKSTVTTLLGDMFSTAGKNVFVGGNIGTPLAHYLSGDQGADIAVLEVSSYQLDTGGKFRPDVAVLLNITPDHLDRYDDFGAYALSKFRIAGWQSEHDAFVFNHDDPVIVEKFPDHLNCTQYSFGVTDGPGWNAFIRGSMVVLRDLQKVQGEEEYDLTGSILAEGVNRENAMAAVLAARIMGCPTESIRQAIAAFESLEHRLSQVAEIGGVKFFDDSKATNIGAVKAALSSFDQPVILIAGGRDKEGDFSLLQDIAEKKIKHLVLIGEAGAKIAAALGACTGIDFADDMHEAVGLAFRVSEPGDIVLLSPACASFDMYTSYSHRGDVFTSAVRKLRDTSSGNMVDEALPMNG
ncbi:UDP-N-acetylmuramoyl-L-alanine--D-glutamate ligase [Thermodesulfobacteriota bacterium]